MDGHDRPRYMISVLRLNLAGVEAVLALGDEVEPLQLRKVTG